MARPSQKVIAEMLGISVSAVSLALRDQGKVSQALVAKVKKVAEEIGYVQNPLLSSLASKRFRESEALAGTPIALIEGTRAGGANYVPFLEAAAKRLGYEAQTYPIDSLRKYRNPCLTLYNRGVQGIILSRGSYSLGIEELIEWRRFSVVQCGMADRPTPFDTVRPDIFQGMKLAYERVRALGYQRIGFALGRHDPMFQDDEARFSAAHGLQRLAGETDPIAPYFGPMHDKNAFLNWFEVHRPQAVIGFHQAFCYTLLGQGYRVPEDVGYATLHLSNEKHLHKNPDRPVSGNDQNLADIATRAIYQLDQHIRHRIKGAVDNPVHLLVPSNWIEGSTLAPQK